MVKFNKLEVLKSSHASTTSQMLPAHTTIKCLVKLTIFFNTNVAIELEIIRTLTKTSNFFQPSDDLGLLPSTWYDLSGSHSLTSFQEQNAKNRVRGHRSAL